MFIVEGSKRRIIASLIVICFIVSSCFSVLSEVVYAAEQNLGKKEKSVSENVTGDVEEGNFSIEQNIKKYVPYEANGKKGIILQTEIATTIATTATEIETKGNCSIIPLLLATSTYPLSTSSGA